jgi:tetratricopeptide (TPR) repeat protein
VTPHLLALATLATLLLAATPRPAHAADPAALAAACRTLQDGVDSADAAAIQRARAAFVALQADEPGSPALAYWIALCCWRAEPLVLPADRDAARRMCKDGIAACDRAFALDARFGEALALKASLQGLALTFVPDAVMTLGAEMQESFARAATLDPKNPRIAFLAALMTLHKPADVGGGPKPARVAFDRAIALYDAGPAPGRHHIVWGHDDALLWSGIALSRSGDWAGARERFRRALAVNPGQRWVRTRLLPEAERHLAAPADSAR